ncbi:MAG: lysylphosphatidylglycerol synthase domain-containing protein [Bacteroidota bacterium]
MIDTQKGLEGQDNKTNTENNLVPIKHAVILAAGDSQRFKAEGTQMPKVLLRLGGLRLLERAVLTLKEAGIEHFRVVTGRYHDQIAEVMGKSKRLGGLDIEYVNCENYKLGNGVSLAAGAGAVDAPFLLTMADHVFSVGTVKDFKARMEANAELPALACDPKIDDVFDLDDATKVQEGEGLIRSIGKEINDYNLIDTGLFYFPAGYGKQIAAKAEAGAHSVSNIVGQFMDEKGMRAEVIPDAGWQDVDNPGMFKEAERRLLKSLIKPTDGWVSKNINRHISTRTSLFLSRFGVSPNAMTTFVFFFTIWGAWLAASGEYMWIAVGGLIFQIASILDGCDGELARLTFKGSQFGAWYDTLTDNLRYIVFFSALGISGYRATGLDIYFFATIIFFLLALYIAGRMAMFTWNKKEHLTNLQVTKEVDELAAKSKHWWEKLVGLLRGIDKQDVSAFIAFILCVVGLYKVMFWLVCIGSVVVAITITRTVNAKKKKKYALRAPDPILFYMIGVVILCLLIYNMEVEAVFESLSTVGGMIFLVFATAIPWIIANTLSTSNLIKHKIPFIDLLYIEITGDAYNAIIPLAGLGGEPYKIKSMTSWMSLEDASSAIVQNRLIHSLTGILFTAITVLITLSLVEMPEKLVIPMIITSCVLMVIGLLMSWATMTTVPTRLSGYILKKLKFLNEYRNEPLPFSRFIISFFFKMLGRALSLVEIYVIFILLGQEPHIAELITVVALLSLSSTIFFVIPQGLGVSEGSSSWAFQILGLGGELGLIFGLIRRSRVIFWAILGVAIHVTVLLIRRANNRRRVREVVRNK